MTDLSANGHKPGLLAHHQTVEAFRESAVQSDTRVNKGRTMGTNKEKPKAHGTARTNKPRPPAGKPGTAKKTKITPPAEAPIKRLAGGNPKIAKADGDAPVQNYITQLPGWKRDIGQRLDALIVKNVPKVCKAVKWNSPFYGTDDKSWFLAIHAFTRYVKVTFFCGTSLKPVPSGCTANSKNARWVDIHEDDGIDEAQMADWIKQAAALPGWGFGKSG